MPSGDRRSFSAPAGDTTTLNAPGSRQMRARETNGSILIAVTAKRGEMALSGSAWATFQKNAQAGRLTKHALWRQPDGRYHTRRAGLDADTLIGMVERVDVTPNSMVRFHVTVRGIVSVPIWWFDEDEYECRVHRTWGCVFTKQVGMKTSPVKQFFKIRSPADVQRHYDESQMQVSYERIYSKCFSCYFRV